MDRPSVTGRRWTLPTLDPGEVRRIAATANVPDIVARVLAARGIGPEGAARFLDPRLSEALPDPSHLDDMDAAVERLVRAVTAGEPIAIFGDYDVDGATSAALLHRFLRAVGATVIVYVPDRMSEGYGPNAAALERLAAQGAKVLITVDCGVTAHEALAAGKAAGLDQIVVDHHAAADTLPAALVINPNRRDETSPHKTLAAVGVAFLLAVAVNRALRESDWYARREEPDLRHLLDLVALGTVADVVPLDGLNRVFVAQGLKVARAGGNAGMVALAQVAGVKGAIDAYHLGFVLGPRVNAGGRVGKSDLGARLLASDDAVEVAGLARELDALNRERRDIEAGVLAEASAQLTDCADEIAIAVGDWHPGVIGIVASRLKDKLHRPTLVLARSNGVAKGSGRSNEGFDLGGAVLAARDAGLLINGGGHPRAAGVTVALDKIEALTAFLRARAKGIAIGPSALALDGWLALSGATPELVGIVSRLGPFGVGNREPRFAFADARVEFADVVGTAHVRARLVDQAGARVQAIAFRAAGTPLGKALLESGGTTVAVAGVLRADDWNGRARVQLQIEDVAA